MTASQAVRTTFVAVLFVVAAAAASTASAGTLTVLHAFRGFPGGDGANPHAVPIMDDKGDLYGTASAGVGCGIVYKLHKTRSGTWKETILYTFMCGDDGYGPSGGLVFDNKGNLYGDTQLGGTGQCFFFGGRVGCGVVFELTPTKKGAWTETVLYSFPAPLGGTTYGGPLASLTFDGKGQLFGTTVLDDFCGGDNHGSVFRLKLAHGTWRENDVHDFCGTDGSAPGYGALVLDPAGNFYGTTMEQGGDGHLGVVFELSPSGRNKWAFNVIHDFTFQEGGQLEGGLTLDASGNLYGTEFSGGLSGHGSVYELSPSGGAWNLNVLYDFTGGGPDGTGPWANPVFDSGGNLFGTTQAGGEAAFCDNCGTIYELVPQAGGQWKESVVYSFGSQQDIADGSDPVAGLVRAADGNFYGTTYAGGDSSCNCGVVFEFSP